MQKYKFGDNILNAIDVSVPQSNYWMKYGDDAVESQSRFFQSLGVSHLFARRVVAAYPFGTNVMEISDLSFSGYESEKRSRCNGYDGVITSIPEIPLFSGWGDCPQLLVAGENSVGLVHTARDTLDNYILTIFFEMFFRNNTPRKTKVGFSPYIFPESFDHQYVNLKREDWFNKGCIYKKDNLLYVDLFKMIEDDLLRLGITPENIMDAKLNSFKISEDSFKRGGYSVSHRHALSVEGAKEGRGGLCIMIRG